MHCDVRSYYFISLNLFYPLNRGHITSLPLGLQNDQRFPLDFPSPTTLWLFNHPFTIVACCSLSRKSQAEDDKGHHINTHKNTNITCITNTHTYVQKTWNLTYYQFTLIETLIKSSQIKQIDSNPTFGTKK